MISPDSGRQWRSPVCPCLSRIPDLARPILAYYGILARKLLLHQRCLRDTDNQNDRVDGSPGDGDIEGKTSFCLSPTLSQSCGLQVMATKVYTSNEFKRERENFISLCKNLERADTRKWLSEVLEVLFRDRGAEEKKVSMRWRDWLSMFCFRTRTRGWRVW